MTHVKWGGEMGQYQSIFRPQLFQGQRILVTGGGSGIGRCTAHELAALGAHVVIVGRDETKLARVVSEILEDGGVASSAVLDIRDEAAVAVTLAKLLEAGPLHGLVNNAGGQFPAPLASINQKGFETVVRTNLVGGFLVARELFNQCLKSSGGAIVNVTAEHFRGMPGMGHSGAARAGMENFTRTAAVEWASYGVRVNAVAPGLIASSGLDRYPEPVRSLIPQLKTKPPVQRFGTESEVSAAIVFLLSPAAAYITGATLRVDGALSLTSPLWPAEKPRHTNSYQGFHRAESPEALKDDE